MQRGASETAAASPRAASMPKKRTLSGASGASEEVSEQSAFRQTRVSGERARPSRMPARV